jgi:hypothetical protein
MISFKETFLDLKINYKQKFHAAIDSPSYFLHHSYQDQYPNQNKNSKSLNTIQLIRSPQARTCKMKANKITTQICWETIHTSTDDEQQAKKMKVNMDGWFFRRK